MERLQARLARKKLSAIWNGGVLVDGTQALVPKQTVAERERSDGKRRSVALAASDRGRVRIARSNIPGPQPHHFGTNSLDELRRLLRSLNISTSGHEEKEELLRLVRFATECDDPGFDSAPLPEQLERWQLNQAYLLVVIYFYAPCTRAPGLLTHGVPRVPPDPFAPPAGPRAPSPDALQRTENPPGTPLALASGILG